jgi:hypothetical protein
MIIKLDKSIFIQFLHMCNWQKNWKNFKKRSRKHFFKGVWSFLQNFDIFDFWLLTSYEIILELDKTYSLCACKKKKKIMIIKLDKSIFIQFLHMCNWQKIERISKNGPESTFLWVCEVFYKILTFLTFDFWLPMKSYWNWTKHIPYAHIKKIKKIMIIKLDKSIFIQFLHMCNWQKNRKNFEKRSRKHFFKGW